MSKNGARLTPVLVVDDSAISRKLVEMSLPSQEYKLLFAKTAHEALALFAMYRPGLVVTDWHLPDLSGTELCRRLRTDFQHTSIYIILLTGVSDPSTINEGLNAGADDYLTKPYNTKELLARVKRGRMIRAHRESRAETEPAQR